MMVLVGGVCLLAGCQDKPVDVDLGAGSPTTGSGDITRRPRYVYGVKIGIWTFRVPLGQLSKNKALWSCLDEERTALKSKILGLNGIRVGVGGKGDLEKVDKILKTMMASNYSKSVLQIFNNKSGAIVVGRNMPAQTIFLYSGSKGIAGNDYPPGDNLIRISAAADSSSADKSLLTITPEIRSDKTELQIVREHGTARLEEVPLRFPFKVVRFQLKMTNGEFIIIAPGVQANRPTSLGHCFLTSLDNKVEFEQLLVLHPEVVRIEMKN